MTAIITKQNAKDKAFINSDGSGGDYPLDAVFDSIEAQSIDCDTITVNKEATFTVDNEQITFANHESRIKTLEQTTPDYPQDATFKNITVNESANFKIDDKTISFANHETRIATLEQSSGGDSLFTPYSGYDYFRITNDVLKTGSITINIEESDNSLALAAAKNYYYLSIHIPDSITSSITNSCNVINITIHERIFYSTNAECITDFIISFENGKYKCPIITFVQEVDNHNECTITYKNSPFDSGVPAIFIHEDLNVSPHDLYVNGYMSIVYLLNQSGIQAIPKEIKCDIIDARNCFKLHESDVPYMYKPKYFKERTTLEGSKNLPGGEANKILEELGKYWSCIWTFDNSQQFIEGQTFQFEEFCFGNTFTLKWSEKMNSWVGPNVKMVIPQSEISVQDSEPEIHQIYLKHNNENYKLIKLIAANLNEDDNYVQALGQAGKISFYAVYKDGTKKSLADANIARNFEKYNRVKNYDRLECYMDWIDKSKYNKPEYHFEYVETEINLNNITTILKRKFDHSIEGFPVCSDESNTIERLAGLYQNNLSNTSGSTKNIELHLFQEFTTPRDEINWDGITNPFIYIIDHQFYRITPNPIAATTLYTDYNITSAKIITADNITTMRSDLNLVTNTVDVISWDVNALQSELEAFEQEVRAQMEVTEAMDIVDGIMTVVDIGFAIPGIVRFFKESSAGRSVMRFFERTSINEVANVSHELEDLTEQTIDTIDSIVDDIRDFDIVWNRARSARNIDWEHSIEVFNKIIEWVNAETQTIQFTGEYSINPTTSLITLSAAFQTALKVRDTLKPALLEITNNIIDIHDTIADAGFRLTENDFIKNELETPEVVNEIGRVKFTFKNSILDGEFTFRAVWKDSPTDWDDVTLKFKHNVDADTHKLVDGYKIVEYSTKYPEQISKFKQPVITNNEIVIDPVQHPEDPTQGIDEFDDIQILSSNIRTYIDDTPAFHDLVYRDELNNYALKNEISTIPNIDLSGYTTNESFANTLANYMTKTNETSLNLDNGSETANKKLVIYPVNDNQFSISLYTPAEKRMISIVPGIVDFGYNQVHLQNLFINNRSIQSVIKSDDSNSVIATDMSIYTAAAVDKIINESLTDTLQSYTTNESLTNTLTDYALKTEITEVDLSGYRKVDDLIVVDAAQSLTIGSIDSYSDLTIAAFENITTASVEYSDEIYNEGITFIGTFILVADESIRYDFEITPKNSITLYGVLKVIASPIEVNPAAGNFVWDKTNGGLWLTTGKGTYSPTYRVILKSAIVGPIDKLVLNSQLDEFVQKSTINSVYDAFSNSDMNPGMTPEAWIFNESFEYTDENVLSSQATKLLVDKTVKQSKEALLRESSMMNTTITHYTPIEAGERIDDYEVGKPVFLSGHVYKQDDGNWISSTVNDSTDCISSVKINGTWKEYIGIITSIDTKNNTSNGRGNNVPCITFATHGDMLFEVDDSNIYQIGDVVLYDGRIVDEDYAMTLRIQQSIAGKITAKINEQIISLFKY